MNKLTLLVAVFLFTGCAGKPEKPYHHDFPHTGAEIDAYLLKELGAKTYKKWNSAVSDDTAIVDLTIDGDTVKGTVR